MRSMKNDRPVSLNIVKRSSTRYSPPGRRSGTKSDRNAPSMSAVACEPSSTITCEELEKCCPMGPLCDATGRVAKPGAFPLSVLLRSFERILYRFGNRLACFREN